MKLEDFKIGERFYNPTGRECVCTDIGTRTIVAIPVPTEDDEESKRTAFWIKGPPYMVTEEVYNERQIKECFLDRKDQNINLAETPEMRTHSHLEPYSSHFDLREVNTIFRSNEPQKHHYRNKLLEYNRVFENQVLCPYSYGNSTDENPETTVLLEQIKYLNMHTRDFGVMDLEQWIELGLEDAS